MFRILVVCTANICRSPAAAALLRRELAPLVADGTIRVDSAGVAAVNGMPACDLSSALVGEFVARQYPGDPVAQLPADAHAARRVTPEMVREADLILALDRSHRAELARVDPAARPRTFTLRQAARLSEEVNGYMAARQMPSGTPPVPPDRVARLRWWVGELDAARGMTPQPPRDPKARREDPMAWHADDVPDPHVLGYQIHGAAIELAEAAILMLSSGVSQVVAFGTDEVGPEDP